MTNKHPHDECIRAWLDGAEIEFRHTPEEKWVSMRMIGGNDKSMPFFYPDSEYRIKPVWQVIRYKPVRQVIRYRRFQFASLDQRTGHVLNVVRVANYNSAPSVDSCAASHGFVRWIDADWQEIEA